MDKQFATLIGLALLGMVASLFGLLKISQDEQECKALQPYKFVAGKKGMYCYVAGEHRKDLVSDKEFDTLELCKKSLD